MGLTTRPLRIGWYVHPLRLGGVERFLLRLAERLDPEAVRVHALFGNDGPVVDAFREAGLATEVVFFDDFREGFKSLTRSFVRLDLDLVQTNMFSPIAACVAGQLGIPHVWRVGGHRDVALRRMDPRERADQLALVATSSAAIVCNSRYAAEPFADVAGPAPVVIPNAIGLPNHTAPPAARPRDPSAPRICMLAHYDAQKRHGDLLRAARIVADRWPTARFRIFGSTFDEPSLVAYRDELGRLVRELDLEEVATLGPATRDTVGELLAADVAVLPSVGESCSNAVLEAMVLGTPVVAADSGGHPELIEHGRTGLLVPPDSPAELAAALAEVLADPGRARRMADAARRHVVEHHDFDLCAREYLGVYRECVAEATDR